MDALEDAGNDAVEDDVDGPPEEVSFQNDAAAQGMLMGMVLPNEDAWGMMVGPKGKSSKGSWWARVSQG